MEKFTAKNRTKPTTTCQYAEKCYRLNPHHFMEYNHEHLDEIMSANSEKNIDEYEFPFECSAEKPILSKQIKIILDLFPQKGTNLNDDGKKTSDICNTISNVTEGRANRIITSSDTSTQGTKRNIGNDDSSCSNSGTSTKRHAPNIHDFIKVVLPKGNMAKKLEKSRPYNYFLTVITSSQKTHDEPLSITFQEIFDPSLGELESSVQINYMVDVGWLLGHYHFAGCLDKPLLILYGNETPELHTISQKKPQVCAHLVQMGNPFATHHTKMMLLGYKDGSMRVVVSTANLYEDDWHNRTQGLWLSEKLEAMSDSYDTVAGESSTGFRNDLLRYLTSYNNPKLQPWLVRIRKTDFTSVNVFLVTSVPGTHYETTNAGYPYGHARVSYLLSKHATEIEDAVPVVAQSSSLGSFGANVNVWLGTEFLNSFRRDSRSIGLRTMPSLRVIYPSFNNVTNSHDGLLGGGCLPYGNQVNQKQPWLQQYFYQWKANCRYRSQAMPHIKTYCRWNGDKLYWFLLTSANISKAAWGSFNKTAKLNVPIRVNNYEAGVLFLPKFLTNTDYFSMNESDQSTPIFPKLYDIPLTKYAIDDTPFLSDCLFDA